MVSFSTSCLAAYVDKCFEVMMRVWCSEVTGIYLWAFSSEGNIRTECLAMRVSLFA